MFRVYFTNFQYYSQNEGKTLEEAIQIAKQAGFDACIVQNGNIVATWSILGGTKLYR